MAGGMVVIGVLLIYFDVATAMILFSIIQLAANGLRAFQWWSFVRWDIFWLYCVGGAVAFAACASSRSSPTRRWSICCSD